MVLPALRPQLEQPRRGDAARVQLLQTGELGQAEKDQGNFEMSKVLIALVMAVVAVSLGALSGWGLNYITRHRNSEAQRNCTVSTENMQQLPIATSPVALFTLEHRVSDMKPGETACLFTGSMVSVSGTGWVNPNAEIKPCGKSYMFSTPIRRTAEGFEFEQETGITVRIEDTDKSFKEIDWIKAKIIWRGNAAR